MIALEVSMNSAKIYKHIVNVSYWSFVKFNYFIRLKTKVSVKKINENVKIFLTQNVYSIFTYC